MISWTTRLNSRFLRTHDWGRSGCYSRAVVGLGWRTHRLVRKVCENLQSESNNRLTGYGSSRKLHRGFSPYPPFVLSKKNNEIWYIRLNLHLKNAVAKYLLLKIAERPKSNSRLQFIGMKHEILDTRTRAGRWWIYL